ncbi:component of SufBCD complex [Roseibacterium sp. SDUM158017]|uniref:component of SufBCD complex n=1 Tax=Roseicyclus salinarum TaxID=3036773 RepID=UPI00241512A3|nr:component of SufBCD complex [Roseibacterium sp. SDUM158017]MDG4648845.1 component of SufBCD complex [Roseibacterium sp. SDUM158017]
MDFLDLVTEVIDLRSFSNLWYWIVLAMLWSTMSHWTIGVPYHIVARARRGDERARRDMQALAEINGERILTVTDQSAPVLVALATFLATGLAVTGWLYRVEFCQALFLLIFPAMLVGALTVLTARKLRATGYADVAHRLRVHRVFVQMLGVLFIFVTAFWGMYTNVTVGPLG